MIGEKLGPFQIDGKLGQGAMGVVYRAIYETTGQPVAVKVIQQDTAARGNASERFDRESDILRQFRHPNIVQHIGTGFSRTRGLRYYAMEYVPGVNLEQVLQEKGAMPWRDVIRLGIQICEALQYAHDRGIVHRDLKPSNLMVTQKGELKLTDFGIAKDLDRTALTADGRTLGTAAYMAPEQIRGTPEVSHKTDLYALGCVLYQMLTGHAPFEGKSALQLMHKHLDEPPPRPSARNPQIPLALDNLVVALMAKNRDDRPWDAEAAAHALRELRDKLERKESVPMVFGGPDGMNPTRLGAATEPATSAGSSSGSSNRTRKAAKRKPRERVQGRDEGTSLPAWRARIETYGLIAALVAIVGFIAYMLWPPGQDYLYRKAAEGMASTIKADRNYARDRYLADLDRRFPDHPYKKQARQWRDELLLEGIERRAGFLESPNMTAVIKPDGEVERSYALTFKAVAKALDEDRDSDALTAWEGLRIQLDRIAEESKEERDRGWSLLVRNREAALRDEIEGRRKVAENMMIKAAAAQLASQLPPGSEAKRQEAIRLWREVIAEYAQYQSMAKMVNAARAGLSGAEAPAPEPGPPSPDPDAP